MIVIVVENTQITEGKTGHGERLRTLKILILTSLIKLFLVKKTKYRMLTERASLKRTSTVPSPLRCVYAGAISHAISH